VKLSAFARLLFIGTWNFARCDAGHLDDDPEALRLKILPTDKINAAKLIEEIIEIGMIQRFETEDGRKFLKIKRFSDHQKVDERWATRCPYCSLSNSPKLAETPTTSPQDRMGRDGKGKEEEKAPSASKILSVADLVGEGVDEKHAEDWLRVRKEQRAPLTRTAWDGVKREAEKAKVTNGEAVRIMAEKSWRGFNAEWLKNKPELSAQPKARQETCVSPGCPRPWHVRREGRVYCAEHQPNASEPVQQAPPQSLAALTEKLAGSFGVMK
jgi:hypothetical protein